MEKLEAPGHPLDGAPIIYRYTRAQTISDGALIDVTEVVREAGIRIPTAVTPAVWDDCVAWTDEDRKRSRSLGSQDEKGRLWDVLWMAKANLAMRKNQPATAPLIYSIRRLSRPGRGRTQRVELKLIISGGDRGEPVLSILQPNED